MNASRMIVIEEPSPLNALKNTTWYLHKGYPRRTKSGSSYSAYTPQLKYARKFKDVADAAATIRQFTPAIFTGNEKIIEFNNG